MIDKFLKATGLKNEKEFLTRYPTEDSFFNEYPEYMPYKKGGVVNHMQYGGYQPQTRRQGNIVITEDTPMDTFIQNVQPIDPYNNMSALMNPYAGYYNQSSIPTQYEPFKQVQYDGIQTPNYMRTQFNPQTGSWDSLGQTNNIELQPQYQGQWNDSQMLAFENTQPEQIGGYRTTRGRRKRRRNTDLDANFFKLGGQYQEGKEYDLTIEEIDSLKKLGYDFENL